MSKSKIAIVQAGSIFYDTPATIDKLEKLTQEAAKSGADLILFPEGFVGGYPKGLTFGLSVYAPTEEGRNEFKRYFESAIEYNSSESDRIAKIAANNKVFLVVGVIERDGGTLYFSVFFYSPEGEKVGKHRKIVPTTLERCIWGAGDGSTMPVLDTKLGKIGAAICWTNYMPLLRMAYYKKATTMFLMATKFWILIATILFVIALFINKIFFTNSTAETNFPNIEKMDSKNGNTLRILTFNTWYFGKKVENGLDKIVKHIKLLKPDIVALQEIQTASMFKEFLEKLGAEWSGVIPPNEYPDIGIITIHTIDDTTLSITPRNKSIGVIIHLKNSTESISFWGMHLDQYSYGPYAANNKMVTKMEQIFSGESTKNKTGRKDNINELLKAKTFLTALEKSIKAPIIVAGDFNTPSHLDWIKENEGIHGGWTIEWPATLLLQTKTGLIDSSREIFPNPIKNPGNTWTMINRYGPEWDYSIPETQDRIDYILYKSLRLKPINSFVYSGNEPFQQVPNHETNDFPSDHFAVITDFSWITTK